MDTHSFYQAIGYRIREIRVKEGLTQAELAEKTGLSVPVISSIENAHSRIWLSTFASICEALQVSADDVLRLNTPLAKTDLSREFSQLFEGSDRVEAEAIIRIAKQVRAALDAQKKELEE